jgi:hypothetical protein
MKDKKEIWKEIAAKYGIEDRMFDYATFEFVGTIYSI